MPGSACGEALDDGEFCHAGCSGCSLRASRCEPDISSTPPVPQRKTAGSHLDEGPPAVAMPDYCVETELGGFGVTAEVAESPIFTAIPGEVLLLESVTYK